MIKFVLGPAGSGKTTYMIEQILDDLAEGKHVILLVPEQAAVQAESRICTEAERRGVPQVALEVLNFKRLCNRVFREVGGISYHGISSGAKSLLLWEALYSVLPFLHQFQHGIDDAKHFIPTLLSAIEEFKTYGVTAEALASASRDAEGDEDQRLADKLHDLALIYSSYQSLIDASWEDPSDDLTRLGNLLSKHAFFENTCLYLDDFKGFTPEQHRILSYAFRQAEKVTVTFCLRQDSDNMAFEAVLREYERLFELADGLAEIHVMSSLHRFQKEPLTHLENNMWRAGVNAPYSEKTECIRAVTAQNAYDEAEFVAIDIQRRLREERLSYRDFAVIARDIHTYEGILDAVFSRHGLPCRLSVDRRLIEKPLFKLITGAFRIRNSDYELEDVMVYLKTGLAGITIDECDELECYAYRWNIRGQQWYHENDWYMNPDGYTDILTEDNRDFLRRVNATRRRVVAPLRKLHESLDGSQTVRGICTAVMIFLEELDVLNTVASSGSDDDVRLWNCFCDALDTMVETLPDRKVNGNIFLELFTLVIAESSIGTLPATIDEIAIGSAGQIRTDNVKHTYLLGLNEGVFPATPTENGFFSDNEKATLETWGIVLSPTCDVQSVAELYIFYLAACTPSESLTLIHTRSDLGGEPLRPSLAFERICALFPHRKEIDTATMPLMDRIQTKEAALEYAFLPATSAEILSLKRFFSSDPEYQHYFETNRQSLSSGDEQLSEATIHTLFPGDLSLTQSRLDRFVLCAFGYGCTYLLKLKETKPADFRPTDIGNFVHRVLEKFFSDFTEESGIPNLSQSEIDARIDDILEDYLRGIFGSIVNDQLSKRAMQLFLRLRRTVRLLVKNLLEEFSQSAFVPRFFEMPISDRGEPNTIAPLKIPLPDGTSAFIYGVADRVDICRKEKDVYVRIVDYKTGKKEFSLSDIQLGLNLQMLLYLFSIWKDENGNFRRAVQCEGDIYPAGVLYFKANTGNISAELNTDDAVLYELASSNLKRNGLLIDDEEVLRLMEEKLSGRYIPVKMTKDGRLSKGSGSSTVLASLSEMGHLMHDVCQTVARIATEIKSGKAHCRPLKDAKHNGCKYCPHKTICRNPAAFVDQIIEE